MSVKIYVSILLLAQIAESRPLVTSLIEISLFTAISSILLVYLVETKVDIEVIMETFFLCCAGYYIVQPHMREFKDDVKAIWISRTKRISENNRIRTKRE